MILREWNAGRVVLRVLILGIFLLVFGWAGVLAGLVMFEIEDLRDDVRDLKERIGG